MRKKSKRALAKHAAEFPPAPWLEFIEISPKF